MWTAYEQREIYDPLKEQARPPFSSGERAYSITELFIYIKVHGLTSNRLQATVHNSYSDSGTLSRVKCYPHVLNFMKQHAANDMQARFNTSISKISDLISSPFQGRFLVRKNQECTKNATHFTFAQPHLTRNNTNVNEYCFTCSHPEKTPGSHEVRGSIPLCSTKFSGSRFV